jgi:cytoskeletal protein CcmA (bactofilin family)
MRTGPVRRPVAEEKGMFRKEPEVREVVREDVLAATASAAKAEGPEYSTRSVSYVGPTMYLCGEIAADEGLVIEGTVKGVIRHNKKTLTVGKQGRVEAEIYAKVVDVRGRVDGAIHGEEIVHLYPTAVVTGTIHCTRIVVDDGAEFNGTLDMSGKAVKAGKAKLAIADTDERIAKVAG